MKAEDIYNKALIEYPIKEKLNEKAVGTYDANYPRRKAFVAGAEWMQDEMIKKAVKWMYNYFVIDHYGMTSAGFGLFELAFKQAMQDESK